MIVVHDEVQSALHSGKPVVALESAVITAGLPKQPIRDLNARWRSKDKATNVLSFPAASPD